MYNNLRELLIQHGFALTEETGAAGLALRDLVRSAGVRSAPGYDGFSDKSELLGAIYDAGFADLAGVLEDANGVPGAFADRLKSIGLAYVRFAEQYRPVYDVMFGVGCDLGPMETSDCGERLFGLMVRMITEGQRLGDVWPGDPRTLARVIWSLFHGVAMLRLGTEFSDGGEGETFMTTACLVLRTGL